MEHKITFKQRVKLFFKRNCYSIVVVGCALVLTVALAITAIVRIDMSRKGDVDVVTNQQNNQTPPKKDTPKEEVKPSSTAPVMFAYPVKDYTLGKTFTDTSLVYNETLKEYTTHLGMDFIVPNGSEVMASYDGTVESVNYDSLTGTQIVIDHGNGLKTSYQSLSSDVDVAVGQTVSSGQVIAKASDSAGGEKLLGAHVHFGAILNGLAVNPMNYLGEK